ncbi:hypothetical protein CVT26_000457 [Gymnopilus dilepis]|uniref:Fe2OG dioxygenase domain-containing protein n=1 Tax=Gymnopilus dilepis TaxID=231916 RepID=A0A409WKY6_9AGAR|nr:hypothetical protein CVT26_000457 [Gymnopilus dilepis]
MLNVSPSLLGEFLQRILAFTEGNRFDIQSPTIDSELLFDCHQLVLVIKEAYDTPIQLEWSAEDYIQAQKKKKVGDMSNFPRYRNTKPNEFIVFRRPCTIVDRDGRILVWYLPDQRQVRQTIIESERYLPRTSQARFFQIFKHIEDQLKHGTTSNETCGSASNVPNIIAENAIAEKPIAESTIAENSSGRANADIFHNGNCEPYVDSTEASSESRETTPGRQANTVEAQTSPNKKWGSLDPSLRPQMTDRVAKPVRKKANKAKVTNSDSGKSRRMCGFYIPPNSRILAGELHLSASWRAIGQPDLASSPYLKLPGGLSLLKLGNDSFAWAASVLWLLHPRLARRGGEVMERIRQMSIDLDPVKNMGEAQAWWPTPFTSMGFISNKESFPHRDPRGVPEFFDLLLTLGSYTGGRFYLSDLGIAFQYDPGTIIANSGKVLKHEVPRVNGDRVCYAQYFHKLVLETHAKNSSLRHQDYNTWMTRSSFNEIRQNGDMYDVAEHLDFKQSRIEDVEESRYFDQEMDMEVYASADTAEFDELDAEGEDE